MIAPRRDYTSEAALRLFDDCRNTATAEARLGQRTLLYRALGHVDAYSVCDLLDMLPDVHSSAEARRRDNDRARRLRERVGCA